LISAFHSGVDNALEIDGKLPGKHVHSNRNEATRMKGKFLNELQPGHGFSNSVFAIRDVARKQSNNGSDFLACRLADRTGNAPAKMWSVTDEQLSVACTAQLVRISGEMQSGEYAGSIIIRSLEAVEPPENLDEFLPPLPANCLNQQKKFCELIASVEQPYLRLLLDKVFEQQNKTWQSFCNAVAATSMHHAYRGGLLDHTIEVARLCHLACKVLPLRRDFLVTCALLHDIGKIEEMDHGLACGEYSTAGNLIGHTVLGMQIIASACDSIPGFPPDLKNGVMHMILSHHGKMEFGAAKTPMCAEAQVLAANDLVSARVEQCQRATAGAAEGKHSAPIYGWDSRFVHVGDFGLGVEMIEEGDQLGVL